MLDPFTGLRLAVGEPLSPLRGRRAGSVRVVTRFARRGLHTLAPPSLVLRDPLDLARVEVVSTAPAQQVLVLPRTEPVRWLTSERSRRLERTDGRAAADALAAVDLDGLRPYRPGTPASRIHWPALARGAGLIERRLLADGDTRPLVVLDAPETDPSTQPQLLDAAVRATASLVLELARGGGCGLLLPGDSRPTVIDRELARWPAAYARLALVKGGEDGGGARSPALGRRAHPPRLGPTIYVAAVAPERSPATAPGSHRGLTVLVLPRQGLLDGHPPGLRIAMQATLEVSGCVGFRLGARREGQRRWSEAGAA